MVCNNCGKELPEKAKFCTECGATMTAAAAVPAEKKSGVKPLLIVLIAVGGFLTLLLIIAIIVVCVLLGSREKQPELQPELPEGQFGVIVTPDGSYEVIMGGENPVPERNPYRDCYNAAVGFVLPDSADRYYARSELEHLSPNALKIAFNEIFARRGYYGFKDSYIQEYFDAMPWYERASASYTLNSYENANAVLLEVLVREQEGTLRQLNNAYLDYRGNSGSWLAGDSDVRYLDADDLERLGVEELTLRKAEILARHGVVFQDKALQQFFCCKQWYTPSVEEADFDTEANLNDQEICNIQLIQVYEDWRSGKYEPSRDNKYIACYDPAREEILPQSATVELTYADLKGLTKEELAIARNEIICRYGYVCGKQELVEYFLLCSWYRPSYAPLRSDLVDMTLVEYKNMETIYNYEKDPSLGDTPEFPSGSIPSSLVGSWMKVGEQNPIGYRVTTRTFSADGTYDEFGDVYEYSNGGWRPSGLGDIEYIGDCSYQDGVVYVYNMECNPRSGNNWGFEPVDTTYQWQVTVSEDGNTLCFWKDGVLTSEWMRVYGSTSDMMDDLYPVG